MSSRILIVDDDRAIAQLTSIWLKAAGFVVRLAYDGFEALRMAREWRPDLVLLDVRMPGLDGFEVLAEMKAEPELASIPVIYLSANVQESARKDALAAGAAAFLAKPYEPDLVLRAVKRVVNGQSQPRAEELHHE